MLGLKIILGFPICLIMLKLQSVTVRKLTGNDVKDYQYFHDYSIFRIFPSIFHRDLWFSQICCWNQIKTLVPPEPEGQYINFVITVSFFISLDILDQVNTLRPCQSTVANFSCHLAIIQSTYCSIVLKCCFRNFVLWVDGHFENVCT